MNDDYQAASVPSAWINLQSKSRMADAPEYVVEGTSIETLIEQIFGNQEVSDIHVHNARRGCYAVRVDRA
ncbi:DUF1203 domain-containing protein [Janthinobacterium sp. P210006]|uniref:DUF1203 domain-containing protein n=1 Tax=Janthinobacterium sp. P210006 TaxID=3112939 RepID=UPI002E265503|nr:DUF1203 domain-containing protein [Janthinobacterium sp. P210006]